jgi:hypothetical protein
MSSSERIIALGIIEYIVLNIAVPVLAIESYLAKGKNGQLGVTGEGTMLDNAAGANTISIKADMLK